MRLPDRHPRLVIPEVVQTSAMDCGPAALKSVLEGFGIPVSYGRLREACQTDLDGTSIDTLEDVAGQLGLDVEQIMLPADYILVPEARALPAIVVVRLPNGGNHFVVAWRQVGGFVQVMDPATGRRWPSFEQFLSTLYIHTQPVPAASWHQWAKSDQHIVPLQRKLESLGLTRQSIASHLDAAVKGNDWRPLAALEASIRTMEVMVGSTGLQRGQEAAKVLDHLLSKTNDDPVVGSKTIPSDCWSVRIAQLGPTGEEQVFVNGAVLLHVRSRLPNASATRTRASQEAVNTMQPELAAALEDPSVLPLRELFRLLFADGALTPMVLCCALFLAAAGVIVEAILFRSLLDISNAPALFGRHLGMPAIVLFVGGLLLLEFPILATLLGMGRSLELRLRKALLAKLPRLGDRYFKSRLNSDMAERSHSIHRLRLLPELGGQLLRSSFELILTAAGLIWLDPHTTPIAVLAAAFSLLLPLLVQPQLAERELRLRSHSGALGRFYLDAFLGLFPIRTLGAERALRREHQGLLMEWARAGRGLQRLVVWVEGLQFSTGFALAAWLVLDHLQRLGHSENTLLLVYWALNLPVLGQDVAMIAWQYPTYRNITLRLLEPITALDEAGADLPRAALSVERISSGVGVKFQSVSIRVAGHTILRNIDLSIEGGTHVAIVGPSGAGKSSLVGILLGWHRPAEGRVFLDGSALENTRFDELHQQTAWVEPSVHLWNRSLGYNLRYGAAQQTQPSDTLLKRANLLELIESLPQGLQTKLGEGGALVSGGEGQRVRFARALLKPDVRLAILDEPFRGLDRRERGELLARAREHWRQATVICVTHDVNETLAFPRVLVVEEGRIVEDGVPTELVGKPDSRYRTMLEADDAIRKGFRASCDWRRLRLENGRLTEATDHGVMA